MPDVLNRFGLYAEESARELSAENGIIHVRQRTGYYPVGPLQAMRQCAHCYAVLMPVPDGLGDDAAVWADGPGLDHLRRVQEAEDPAAVALPAQYHLLGYVEDGDDLELKGRSHHDAVYVPEPEPEPEAEDPTWSEAERQAWRAERGIPDTPREEHPSRQDRSEEYAKRNRQRREREAERAMALSIIHTVYEDEPDEEDADLRRL